MNQYIKIAIGILLFTFAFFLFTKLDDRRDIKEIEASIKEYRFAKALEYSKQAKNKQAPLAMKQLVFYAAIKAKEFKLAREILANVKNFDKDFKKRFYQIVKILYVEDKPKLLSKVLNKSAKIGLDQNYLITLSRKQENVEKEMQVLLMGRELLLKFQEDLVAEEKLAEAKMVKIDKLENYILERYMNQASLFIAHKDYKSALLQLEKARDLKILDETNDVSVNGEEAFIEYKEQKSEYKYLLGTIYKFLGDRNKAWDLIQISASLGNIQAQDAIEQAKRRYR